ncbi:MAG: ATPase, T2SS/T4P/T4SS family, partial [Planctomycetota bacterium]
VGEIRDRETMATALTAAETGHLVLSTLSTTGAGETIGHIVGMFGRDERARVRARLAEVLRYCVAQWLVPDREGGRVAAMEVLVNDPGIRALVLSGATDNAAYRLLLAAGGDVGMRTFDQHLLRLCERGLVAPETAVNFSSDRVAMQRALEPKGRTEGPAPKGRKKRRVALPVTRPAEEKGDAPE